MAKIRGPRKVHRYSAEFKLKAVKLSDLAGVLALKICKDLGVPKPGV
jgi:transposase-like protein